MIAMNTDINTSAPKPLTVTGAAHATNTLSRLMDCLATRAECRGCGGVNVALAINSYVRDGEGRAELMAHFSEHPALANITEALRSSRILINTYEPGARVVLAMVYAELQRLAPLW